MLFRSRDGYATGYLKLVQDIIADKPNEIIISDVLGLIGSVLTSAYFVL